METDRLIDTLAADLRPARSRMIPLRIGLVALIGGASALTAVATYLGFRADLATAVGSQMFWVKALYALILAFAGFWCAERLARPAASARRGMVLGAVVVALLFAVAVLNLLGTTPDDRLTMWLGRSWQRCPTTILILSLPTLLLSLAVLRRQAPTRLVTAGAAAGLFAGGVAASAYGLHCPETAPAFLATWYSLGVALSTVLGATLGPWVLRWR